MTDMTDNLTLAILAMDAYNRGPNAGLDVPGGFIGNATVSESENIGGINLRLAALMA
jgi:hypothetical protein